ncbi:D-glycero-alpha-D-manno-heptose-1,7-bisphosphate 7-phosphatase [Dethiothermospora halolimnae]|uniref:D-glycero-alpha-D-manno-heptose-1,7-bisphosphate 7-phosphatase n=1 Tax=Dethiothermospora halolimnae TaxID=3114390 RepID=UPI003CCC1E9D
MKRAIFCDRDGVINDNTKHVNKPDDLTIYNEAKEGLKKLYNNEYELFVVTNQGGVELGYIGETQLDGIHEKMIKELKDYCEFKEIVYCPDFHRKSDCRKPKPGMIVKLAKKYDIDLKNSWMIGDMETDITAGIKAGCKTGKIGKKDERADVNGRNLNDLADKILEQ